MSQPAAKVSGPLSACPGYGTQTPHGPADTLGNTRALGMRGLGLLETDSDTIKLLWDVGKEITCRLRDEVRLPPSNVQ